MCRPGVLRGTHTHTHTRTPTHTRESRKPRLRLKRQFALLHPHCGQHGQHRAAPPVACPKSHQSLGLTEPPFPAHHCFLGAERVPVRALALREHAASAEREVVRVTSKAAT